jgi:glycosyltransferase involved in cell wall biosynthesis
VATGKPYFLYTGAIHPRKNIDRLITAFDLFKKNTGSDFQLILAGRFAWQTGSVKEAYDHAEYREEIRFLGYVPDEELPRLTAAAFALVNISLFEGFGVPVLEALNCDVPVLVSDCSSLPEVAGAAGLQVDPTSIAAIAAAMERLSKDAGLRMQLIKAGQEQRWKFSWDATAEKIHSALAEEIAAK